MIVVTFQNNDRKNESDNNDCSIIAMNISNSHIYCNHSDDKHHNHDQNDNNDNDGKMNVCPAGQNQRSMNHGCLPSLQYMEAFQNGEYPKIIHFKGIFP